MNFTPKKVVRRVTLFAALILGLTLFISKAEAQTASNDANTKAMVTAMNNSAAEWNKGNLKAFVSIHR